MNPIRQGDGTGLSVPGVSEVRTGDGTVLWSSGGEIPDSAVYRWKHENGSGSTLSDSIGANDGSISGSTWESVADAQSGHELSHATDDLVDFSTVPEIGVGQDFAIGVTLQPDNLTSDMTLLNHVTGSSEQIFMGIDSGDGDFFAAAYDGNWIDTTDTGGTTTTGRQRFLINYDMTNSNISVYRNATDVSAAGNQNGVITSNTPGFHLAAATNADTNLDGDTDDLIVYDSLLSSSEINDDYTAQPWT